MDELYYPIQKICLDVGFYTCISLDNMLYFTGIDNLLRRYSMLYQKADIVNGQIVITESKEIDQSKLTSDCWLIQFSGLSACENCEIKDTAECGGGSVLEQLQSQ